MVVGPLDVPFEPGPDVFNMIRDSEDVLAVVADFVSVAEESVDPFVTRRGVGADETLSGYVVEDELVCRSLFAVSRRGKDDSAGFPFVGSEDNPLITVSSPAQERFINLDDTGQYRAFVHQMDAKPSEPATDGDVRQPRQLLGRQERNPSLPTDDQSPKLPVTDLHPGKPGGRSRTERFAAARTAVAVFRTTDVSRAATRTKRSLPESRPDDQRTKLGLGRHLL